MTSQDVEGKPGGAPTKLGSAQKRLAQRHLVTGHSRQVPDVGREPVAGADDPTPAGASREGPSAAAARGRETEVKSASDRRSASGPARAPVARAGKQDSRTHDAGPPGDAANQKPRRKVVLPSAADEMFRYPYATHRHPPQSEKEEKQELAELRGARPGREYSTGFILGVVIVVISLVAGIALARLHNRVKALERRIDGVENVVATSSSASSTWASR